MTTWYVANSKEEAAWEQSNGFCKPVPATTSGQKVSCLVFTYEGMADGGRSLMGAVALKGVVVEESSDGYVVKMAYCKPEDDPHLIPKHHVKVLTDEQYEDALSVEILRC